MVGSSSASRCLSDIDGLPVLALNSITCIGQLGLDEILRPSTHSSAKLLSKQRVLRKCGRQENPKSTLQDEFV